MIKAKDATAAARSLIDTPYKDMDCIALIRAVIRTAPGGVADYRCEGTNWLWDSVNNSGKYRHLTERYDGLKGVRAGMLAFKRSGEDVHHVGLVTGEGTVIHSSSVKGCVVETPLTAGEGWELLGAHRYITVEEKPSAEEMQLEEELEEGSDAGKRSTMLVREDGIVIELAGCWSVAVD